MASKASIAARIDLYRRGEKDPSLADKLKLRISEIQQKYSQPPPERPSRNLRNRPFERFGPGPRGRGGGGGSRREEEEEEEEEEGAIQTTETEAIVGE